MSVFDLVQSYFHWEKSTSVTFTVAQNCEKNSKAEYQYSGPLLFFFLINVHYHVHTLLKHTSPKEIKTNSNSILLFQRFYV